MWSVEAATRLDDLEYEDTGATIRLIYLCISEVNYSVICLFDLLRRIGRVFSIKILRMTKDLSIVHF
jgi:hypothetical protein